MPTTAAKSPLAQGMSSGPRATACIPCQKQKVRCIMNNSQPPCQRCVRRRVNCVFRQYSIAREGNGEDIGSALVHDIKAIHDAVDEMRRGEGKLPLPALLSVAAFQGSTSSKRPPNGSSRDGDAGDAEPAVELDAETSPLEVDMDQAPAKTLYHITRLKSLRSHGISPPSAQTIGSNSEPKDLISTGILDLADANRLVDNYLRRSNHYLYDIMGKYDTLASIRQASPILFMAVCTAGALQDSSADRLYRICRQELERLIPNFIFKPSIDLEDLRGLIIACFWINDISWTVSGIAIRRALEVDLPSSFATLARARRLNDPFSSKTSHGVETEAALERMKLWYLLYICDQQLSIFYARSPMLGTEESIRNFEKYLNATPDPVFNQRLMSQVSLLSILRGASDIFSIDAHKPVPTVFKTQLDNVIHQVDAWARKWLSCYAHHSIVGDYPAKAVSMHYHFAKLVVCSYVFRGIPRDNTENRLPVEFRGAAQSAVQSAISIVDSVITDTDLTTAIVGWPHYFHSIIAYACSFLVKIVTIHRGSVDVSIDMIKTLLAKIIELCLSRECGQYHLIHWIGKGLQTLAVNHFRTDQATGTVSESRDAGTIGSEASIFPGGVSTPGISFNEQMNFVDDSSIPLDGSGTFLMPSERVHGFSGIYYNLFNDSPSYPTEEIDNSFLFRAGS